MSELLLWVLDELFEPVSLLLDDDDDGVLVLDGLGRLGQTNPCPATGGGGAGAGEVLAGVCAEAVHPAATSRTTASAASTSDAGV